METESEREPVEILPSNIGEMKPGEVVPILTRAASRIDIVRPKNDFWNGMKENLRGAAAYLEAQKSKIASKTFRVVAGASLVATMVSACARSVETANIPPETLPIATEVFPTSELTPVPTEIPSATPEIVPTIIAAQFEYDFDSERPGYIPAELAETGITGEVVFNEARSAGGTIVTEVAKDEGFVPLAVEGGILSAEGGSATFLPHPAEMLYENSQGVLQSLRFSQEDSGQGYAAYVDESGIVKLRMLTVLPTPPEGDYMAAVSYDQEDRGVVYALRMGSTGRITERTPIVFAEDGQIQTDLVDGRLRIFIDGQRMLMTEGNFETPERGLIGYPIDLGRIPELTSPLSPEQTDSMRFVGSDGRALAYGVFNVETSDGWGIWELHGIFRGEIPAELFPEEYQAGVDGFLFEIPTERWDAQSGRFVRAGESQFIIINSLRDPTSEPVEVYFLDGNDVGQNPPARMISRPEVTETLRGVTPGSSVIIGKQFIYDPTMAGYNDYDSATIPLLEDGVPTVNTYDGITPSTLYLSR
ncbi:MAG TPA: hypothetical protein VJ481_02485 [Patescibacteria group bacterium]|nr:hypothetical protein [Patescibacteria group bacterium]